MLVSPETLRTCHRILLQRLCSSYTYDPTKFSLPANIFLDTMFANGKEILFAWEKHLTYFVVVVYVKGEYRIYKQGYQSQWPEYYETIKIWAEHTLASATSEQWRCLCDMSTTLLDEDLNMVVRKIDETQRLWHGIWTKVYHPDTVERFIVNYGFAAYLNVYTDIPDGDDFYKRAPVFTF